MGYPLERGNQKISFNNSTTSTGIRRVIEVIRRSLSRRFIRRSEIILFMQPTLAKHLDA